MTSPNVVDSSGWLEYFIDTERAPLFAPGIEDTANLIVPVITLYEVFKKVLRERGEHHALQIASVMQSGTVVDLDGTLATCYFRRPVPASSGGQHHLRHRPALSGDTMDPG